MGLITGEHNSPCWWEKKQDIRNKFFEPKMPCQAFYILQQTAVDYSVIIFTILIMCLYSYIYNVTSLGKLNPILYFLTCTAPKLPTYMALCKPCGYIVVVVNSTKDSFSVSLSLCFLDSSVQKIIDPSFREELYGE